MSGVNRLKIQKLTEKGLSGKALIGGMERDFVHSDPSGEAAEKAGITPKRSYGKSKK